MRHSDVTASTATGSPPQSQLARRLAKPGQWLFARAPVWLLVFAAPLLGGSADRPYTLVLAGLCAGSAIYSAAAASRRGTDQRQSLRVSWFALVILVAALATLLQCVPLPPGVRAWLAPGTDQTLRLGLAPLGGVLATTATRALPLSVDPSASLNEVARLLGYLCALLALSLQLRHRGDGHRLGLLVSLSAGSVAALGLLAALGVPLPPPLGVPAEGATRALFPAALYNSNHMAALMGIGAILTLSILLSHGPGTPATKWRALLTAQLALLNVTLVGTLSRAGILVGVLGQLLVLWRAFRPRPTSAHSNTNRPRVALLLWPLLALLAVSGFLLLHQTAHDSLLLRLSATQRRELLLPGSKVFAWFEALPLLRGHLVLGVGRGAFENAFQGLHRLSGQTRFVYLENEWLQAVIDWGVPIAGLLLLLLGLAAHSAYKGLQRRKNAGHRTLLREAALIALLAVALHNLLDFNLQVGGVVLPVLALTAMVEQPRWQLPTRWLALLGATTLVLAIWVLRTCPSHDEDGAALAQAVRDPQVPTSQVLTQGQGMAQRHLLDSHLFTLVAARLWREQRPETTAWLNRALCVNPREPFAQLLVAELLWSQNRRDQALPVLRQAISDGHRLQRLHIYESALSLRLTPAEFLAILPDDELPPPMSPAQLRAEVLDYLGTLPKPPWSLIATVAQHAVAQDEVEAGSDAVSARQSLVWLGQAALAEQAVELAATVAPKLGPDPQTRALRSGLLELQILRGTAQQQAVAEQLAQKWLQLAADPGLLLVLAQAALSHDRFDEARDYLQRMLEPTVAWPLQARAHELRAQLEARAGNPSRAALETQAANQLRQDHR